MPRIIYAVVFETSDIDSGERMLKNIEGKSHTLCVKRSFGDYLWIIPDALITEEQKERIKMNGKGNE